MHLKDFINKTTVLVFISPSCAPCLAKLPSIQAVFATQSIDIELVLVSTGSHNATKALTDELEITLPVLVAPEHENTFRQDYKVPATPFFILINDKGYVGYRGFLNEAWDQLVENWQQDVAIHA
jgi:peroxiredoxin